MNEWKDFVSFILVKNRQIWGSQFNLQDTMVKYKDKQADLLIAELGHHVLLFCKT